MAIALVSAGALYGVQGVPAAKAGSEVPVAAAAGAADLVQSLPLTSGVPIAGPHEVAVGAGDARARSIETARQSSQIDSKGENVGVLPASRLIEVRAGRTARIDLSSPP
jgi:hypothetical protein